MKPFERLSLAAWAALAAASACGVSPAQAQAWPDLCAFKLVWGFPCPGCGMLRALLSAFRGDWSAALSYHPLGLPLLSVWTAYLAWGLSNRLRGRAFSFGWPSLSGLPAAAALALVLAVYAARLPV